MDIIKISKEKLVDFGIQSSFDTRIYFNPIKIVGDIFWLRFKKMLEMAEPDKNKIALDFGHGHGLFLPTLSKYYKEVIGIDIKIHPGTKKILEYFNCKNVKILRIDGCKTTFDDNSFDVIFCADVLEHFKKLETPLNEIYRILKTNGKLIVNSPLETNYFKIMRFMAGFDKPKDHYHDASEIRKKIRKFFIIKEVWNYPNFFGKFRLLEIIKAIKV